MGSRTLSGVQYGKETTHGTAVAADTILYCRCTLPDTDRDTHAGALNFTRCNYTNFTEDGFPNESFGDGSGGQLSGETYPTWNVSKGNMSMGNWTYYTADTPGASHNSMLEAGEMAIILITLPDYGVTANKKFTIELKPAIGPVITIPRTSPGQIDKTMNLH